jgi:hypothetical protein
MSNRYATRAGLKRRLQIASSDTSDDATIDAVLLAVSREIDQWTGRRFQPVTQTRYYSPRNPWCLHTDDILAVTALHTDDNGDRTYGTTWSTADWELSPPNATADSPPQPYTQIDVRPDGDEAFSIERRSARVAGAWGYYDVREPAAGTVNEALNATSTSVGVSSTSAFEVGQMLLLESEQLEVNSIGTTSIGVARARNGTTAATHSSGTTPDIYQYPVVSEAALLQAGRIFRRRDAPFGVAGSPEFGTFQLRAALDPDVKTMLVPFRRPSVS